jgi:hypothetical protein
MQDRIRIDEVHGSAIRTKIGERLRQFLSREETELPANLEYRLNRLRELDEDYLRSITPAMG